MKKIITICLIGVLFLAKSNTTMAGPSVVIDPATGWTGYFAWNDGLGPMDDIHVIPLYQDWTETQWEITMARDGYIDLVTVDDGYDPGDVFALYVDGVLTTWTSEYYDGSGFYHGEYDSLFLSAGPHEIYMSLIDLATGLTSGAAQAEFSAVTYIIPAPGAILLGIIGSGLVSWLRIKRAI